MSGQLSHDYSCAIHCLVPSAHDYSYICTYTYVSKPCHRNVLSSDVLRCLLMNIVFPVRLAWFSASFCWAYFVKGGEGWGGVPEQICPRSASTAWWYCFLDKSPSHQPLCYGCCHLMLLDWKQFWAKLLPIPCGCKLHSRAAFPLMLTELLWWLSAVVLVFEFSVVITLICPSVCEDFTVIQNFNINAHSITSPTLR